MPFIEKQYRPTIDWYITDAQDNKIWESLLGIQKTLEDETVIPKDYFDGALNYAITQLYRKCDIVIAESITFMLLNKYYLAQPRYKKMKDALGLVSAILEAFDSKQLIIPVENDLESILVSLGRIYDKVSTDYIRYEKTVRAKNGDLE